MSLHLQGDCTSKRTRKAQASSCVFYIENFCVAFDKVDVFGCCL